MSQVSLLNIKKKECVIGGSRRLDDRKRKKKDVVTLQTTRTTRKTQNRSQIWLRRTTCRRPARHPGRCPHDPQAHLSGGGTAPWSCRAPAPAPPASPSMPGANLHAVADALAAPCRAVRINPAGVGVFLPGLHRQLVEKLVRHLHLRSWSQVLQAAPQPAVPPASVSRLRPAGPDKPPQHSRGSPSAASAPRWQTTPGPHPDGAGPAAGLSHELPPPPALPAPAEARDVNPPSSSAAGDPASALRGSRRELRDQRPRQ